MQYAGLAQQGQEAVQQGSGFPNDFISQASERLQRDGPEALKSVIGSGRQNLQDGLRQVSRTYLHLLKCILDSYP